MRTANYFVLGELFALLERIELIRQVPFESYDPDDESDTARLVRDFIGPALANSSLATRKLVRSSLEYYSATGSAPFQLLKDRCQELSLPDSECWPRFFRRVGEILFGPEFSRDDRPSHYEEHNDIAVAESMFME